MQGVTVEVKTNAGYEYKNIKWTNSTKKDKENYNRIETAVKHIIDEVEKEKIQRRLFLGKEIIGRIEFELNSIKSDLKKSKKRAYSCCNKKNIITFTNSNSYSEILSNCKFLEYRKLWCIHNRLGNAEIVTKLGV